MSLGRHRPKASQIPDGPSGLGTLLAVGITSTVDERGIAEVVMDNPPVNALDRRRLVRAGRHHHAASASDPEVRVVVLRAEGRGFNAGVDIKEMQAHRGLRPP